MHEGWLSSCLASDQWTKRREVVLEDSSSTTPGTTNMNKDDDSSNASSKSSTSSKDSDDDSETSNQNDEFNAKSTESVEWCSMAITSMCQLHMQENNSLLMFRALSHHYKLPF